MPRPAEARRRLSREQQRSRTRQQLLDAAERVFLRRGYFATSVDEVAEEAGFSKGAVYSNFADKEDLFLALLEEHVQARIQRCADLGRTPGPRPPLRCIR